MDKRYQDQVVMITGAASGFGKRAAEMFAAEGARLALTDISSEALEAHADTLRAAGIEVLTDAFDVSQEEPLKAHVARINETYGRLDVAINNAGMGHEPAPLHMLTAEDFDRNIAVNARGVFLGMKYQIPLMRAAGKGSILNVASAAGLVGSGNLSAYSAAKHAVVGLTRAAADENARKNIRVNALAPGLIKTDFARALWEDPERLAQAEGQTPLRRIGTPEDIAGTALFLASDASAYVTGQTIVADGGETIR